MPELPDLEIYRKTAEKAVKQKVDKVKSHDKKFKSVDEKKISKTFKNKSFSKAIRHGKHLFLQSGNNDILVMHFGMTGVLKYVKKNEDIPDYTKLEFQLANEDKLAYISRRKLGFVDVIDDINKYLKDNNIAQDALNLKKNDFIELLKSKKSMIKTALMDQSTISGIGNVYSDEILYQCGIHPKQKTTDITDKDWDTLYKEMTHVMKTAIKSNARPDQLPDDFLTQRRKEGEKCPVCKGEIKKIKISGRGGYYCPSCQKMKK